MQYDSIESLLSRHYGSIAPVPTGLEQRVQASIQQQVREQQQGRSFASRLRTQPISRRRVVRLVALGSASLGVMSVGMEMLETALLGHDNEQQAVS